MANAVKAYICIECKVGFTKEVVEGLKQCKGIKSVEMVTGPDDVIAVLELDSLHEIGDLVTQHIQLVNGITRTVTCLVV
jgi:DNA-binding Lrp family transcriptional regulator